ncbi:putative protein phosphatase 2C 74 [Porphyridium purpureum]|uniref:PPM-type phosphatase domain-containing protein n=1 Tax=Porphyridium purpureum TaxID=35688 RepID=A0A5J4YJ12_PORPP|nr:putative protein phosphatase 2C 74 [Porphyridium purpureum]|eukprot:POR4293..scf210_14
MRGAQRVGEEDASARNVQQDVSDAMRTEVGTVHAEFGDPNQDAMGVARRKGSYVVWGVFDGHGENGEACAQYARDCILGALVDDLDALHDHPDVPQMLRSAFDRAEKELDELHSGATASHSGSTALVAVLASLACAHPESDSQRSQRLFIANTGDAQAVLVCAGVRARADQASAVAARVLCARHHLANLAELERVHALGKALLEGEYMVDPDDTNNVISVTRALGNRDMKRCGLIHTPDITEFRLDEDDCAERLLVLASDGLWNAHGSVSSEQIVQVVLRARDSDSSALPEPARALDAIWALAKGSTDDCTVIVAETDSR